MSGSSKAGPSIPKVFQDAREGTYAALPLKNPIDGSPFTCGVAGVLSCIGVFLRISEDHCFIAHISANVNAIIDIIAWYSEAPDNIKRTPEEEREVKHEQIRQKLGDALTEAVRLGLERLDVEGWKGWTVDRIKPAVNKELTLCATPDVWDTYGEGFFPILEEAIKAWAKVEVADVNDGWGGLPFEKKKPLQMNLIGGFVIEDPTAESVSRRWIYEYRLSNAGLPKIYRTVGDDNTRWAAIEQGGGSLRLKEILGA